MKSLIVNYLNSRRSVQIQETIADTEKDEAVKPSENLVFQTSLKNEESSSDLEQIACRDSTFLDLDLKFIDDNDTESVVSSDSHKISDLEEEVNTNKNLNPERSFKLTKSNLKTCKNCKYFKFEYLNFEDKNRSKSVAIKQRYFFSWPSHPRLQQDQPKN
jgi:hypothetical protein